MNGSTANPKLKQVPQPFLSLRVCIYVHVDSVVDIGHYLVFNGGDVALVPPVHGPWGLQEVGLHEQGSSEIPLWLQLVAIHDLPKLLVSLQEDKSQY